MAQKQDRDVALLSIRPQFAEAILAGDKRVEFRRVLPSREIAGVATYATAPIKKVIGYFEVKRVESSTPRLLWKRWRRWAGIAKPDYDSYFAGTEIGHAIHIGEVVTLSEPVDLAWLHEGLTPPQSFLYLRGSAQDRLWSKLHAEREAVA